MPALRLRLQVKVSLNLAWRGSNLCLTFRVRRLPGASQMLSACDHQLLAPKRPSFVGAPSQIRTAKVSSSVKASSETAALLSTLLTKAVLISAVVGGGWRCSGRPPNDAPRTTKPTALRLTGTPCSRSWSRTQLVHFVRLNEWEWA